MHVRAIVAPVNLSAEHALARRISCGAFEVGAAKFRHPVENTDTNLGFCFLIFEAARSYGNPPKN